MIAIACAIAFVGALAVLAIAFVAFAYIKRGEQAVPQVAAKAPQVTSADLEALRKEVDARLSRQDDVLKNGVNELRGIVAPLHNARLEAERKQQQKRGN